MLREGSILNYVTITALKHQEVDYLIVKPKNYRSTVLRLIKQNWKIKININDWSELKKKESKMTREQFVKYSFRAYMLLDYIHPRLDKHVECMLIEIDFDNELFCLKVMDTDFGIPNSHYDTFYTSIRQVELPKKSMKILK
jgi:hypothetical protein